MEDHHESETKGTSCECPCHVIGTATCSMCEPLHGSKGGNAVQMATMSWQKAFFEAHMEFMVEKLKKRMEAAWGPLADKAADAVVEAMGKKWIAMAQQSMADQELQQKMTDVLREVQKR